MMERRNKGVTVRDCARLRAERRTHHEESGDESEETGFNATSVTYQSDNPPHHCSLVCCLPAASKAQ